MALSNRLPRTLLFTCPRRFSNTHTLSRLVLRHTRENSTATPQTSLSKAYSPYHALLFVLAGIGAGWSLSQIREYRNTDVPKNPQTYLTSPGLNDKYGSLEDFSQAIEILRIRLPEDAVSTDPDVLEVHGFSENDYHPGMGNSKIRIKKTLIGNISQDHLRQWSSFRNQPKMLSK